MVKLSAGVLMLFIALLLQFVFASGGLIVNLAFAALISFAFIFGIWELLFLVVIAIAVMNWQPALSSELLVFALFPVAAYLARDVVHSPRSVVNAAAIFIGLIVLSLASAGSFAALLKHWHPLAIDMVAGEIFGAMVFLPLYRIGRE